MPHHECKLGILMCEINSKHERGITFIYLSLLCFCSNETARAIFHCFFVFAHSSTKVFGNIAFEEIRLPSQNALAAFALVIGLLVLNLLLCVKSAHCAAVFPIFFNLFCLTGRLRLKVFSGENFSSRQRGC